MTHLSVFISERYPSPLFVANHVKGGTIHGSINLPAQSLYPTIPALYTLFKKAKVTSVIWYCGMHLLILSICALSI